MNVQFRKWHILVFIIVLVATINLAVVWTITKSKDPSQVTVPMAILEAVVKLKQTVDPCHNFYKHACGDEDENGWMIDAMIKYELKVITALGNADTRNASEGELNSHAYFNSCYLEQLKWLDTIKGDERLMAYVERLGGWTLSGRHVEPLEFQSQLETFHSQHPAAALFSLGLTVDSQNSSRYLLAISPPVCPLPTKEHSNDEEIEGRLTSITQSLVDLYGIQNKTIGREGLEGIYLFHNQLISNTTKPKDVTRIKDSYNHFTLNQLNALVPQISWIPYLQRIFQNTPLETSIGGTYVIIVQDPKFLQRLSESLARTLNSPEGSTLLQNYFVYCTVGQISFQTAHHEFDFKNSEHLSKAKVLDLCVKETEGLFAPSVTRLTNRRFPIEPDTLIHVEGIIANVVEAFQENLLHLDSVDSKIKDYAAKKTSRVTWMIGLEQGRDAVNRSGLILNASDYLHNKVFTEELVSQGTKERFMKPIELTSLDHYISPGAAAWNNFMLTPNRITIHTFNLQYPLIQPGHWRSVNYGTLGMLVGHELTHSVGWLGMQYDLEGNLDDSLMSQFVNKTGCFLAQYVNYTRNQWNDTNSSDDELDNVAKFRFEENFADNVGLKLAYYAYKLAKQDSLDAQIAQKALNLTEDQLFFLSYAKTSCTKVDYATHDKFESHSPKEYSVNAPLANLQKFSDAYHCPVGSGMNPNIKCEFW